MHWLIVLRCWIDDRCCNFWVLWILSCCRNAWAMSCRHFLYSAAITLFVYCFCFSMMEPVLVSWSRCLHILHSKPHLATVKLTEFARRLVPCFRRRPRRPKLAQYWRHCRSFLMMSWILTMYARDLRTWQSSRSSLWHILICQKYRCPVIFCFIDRVCCR